MTEKRFTPSGRWIKDNYIDKLLNIDFNTITDRNLCCDLLNQIEDEKKRNGKIATKYFEENEQLKKEGADVERLIDDLGSEELRRQYEEIINGDNDE